jgi:predicted transcriptional regulator
MKSLPDRVLDVLRERPCEALSAREVCEVLQLHTDHMSGERNIRNVANALGELVNAGLVARNISGSGSGTPEHTYIILEV